MRDTKDVLSCGSAQGLGVQRNSTPGDSIRPAPVLLLMSASNIFRSPSTLERMSYGSGSRIFHWMSARDRKERPGLEVNEKRTVSSLCFAHLLTVCDRSSLWGHVSSVQVALPLSYKFLLMLVFFSRLSLRMLGVIISKELTGRSTSLDKDEG